MIECIHCFATFPQADAMGCCPFCGSNPTLRPEAEHIVEADAQFLGFTDAKLLHEAPSWEKAGDILRREE